MPILSRHVFLMRARLMVVRLILMALSNIIKLSQLLLPSLTVPLCQILGFGTLQICIVGGN